MASPSVMIRPTSLAEVYVVQPRVFRDDRGFFLESFNAATFGEAGLPERFVQDNHSRSRRGVLRGLHYQHKQPQGKLVRVVRGQVFDVAADVRRGSPTFGKWVGVTLDDTELNALWIPPGFAHGFCTLSDTADVAYKTTEFYSPEDERGILWNDPTLGIEWPFPDPVLNAKDLRFPALRDQPDLPAYTR